MKTRSNELNEKLKLEIVTGPPEYSDFTSQRNVTISSKQLADTVESFVAACFLSSQEEEINKRIEFSSRILHHLGILESQVALGQQQNSQESQTITSELESQIQQEFNQPPLEELEQKIGYSFNNKSLLCEAMTHHSFQKNQRRSYQRLEFLGDAVVDFLVLDYLFQKHKDFTPSQLNNLKIQCVGNDFFAYQTVKLGLDEYMKHNNSKLGQEIENYKKKLEEELAKRDRNQNTKIQFKNLFGVYNKVLADIFESLIGAVFADSQDLDLTRKILFLNLQFKDQIDIYADPDSIRDHPYTILMQTFQKRDQNQQPGEAKLINLKYNTFKCQKNRMVQFCGVIELVKKLPDGFLETQKEQVSASNKREAYWDVSIKALKSFFNKDY